MLERFQNFIAQHRLVQGSPPVLVGISGGVDSVVLCELLKQANIAFAIAHVNFGLRGSESDADEIFVSGIANNYGVPFFRRYVDTAAIAHERGISIQMAAREIRYDWFNQLTVQNSYQAVAVGTHLNDNAETFILNFTKKTGLKGLTGIKPKRDFIIRPLLPFSKEEIVAFANKHELQYREDSSNADVKYQRNRIRHEVIPALEKINPVAVQSIERTIEHLNKADAFLSQVIEEKLGEIKHVESGKETVSKSGIPSPHHQLFLYHWLAPHNFTTDQLENLWTAKTGSLFHSPSHTVNVHGNKLILSPNTNTQIAESPLSNEQSIIHFGHFKIELKEEGVPTEIIRDLSTAMIDVEKIKGQLKVRSFQHGDYIQPLGMKGKKKISDILIDAKIPKNEKRQLPIICDELGPIWIPNLVLSERVKLGSTTKKIYLITAISIT